MKESAHVGERGRGANEDVPQVGVAPLADSDSDFADAIRAAVEARFLASESGDVA